MRSLPSELLTEERAVVAGSVLNACVCVCVRVYARTYAE